MEKEETQQPEVEVTMAEVKDGSKVKGGLARAAALTPNKRKAIARKAALTRWDGTLPKITHEGVLKLAGVELPCYVTDTGLRVISGRGMQDALRLVDDNASSAEKSGSRLGRLFNSKALKPLIFNEESMGHLEPVKCSLQGRLLHGYQAEALADICDAVLSARAQGFLKTERQKIIAVQCEILLRAFARVGITALVDEVTGYQYDRARTALEEILEEFVAKELRKWVKTFPDEFYHQICRLRGWKLADINKRPVIFGHLTNYLVYKRLAPGVLKELQRLTPKDSKGRRKNKLFQRLTEQIGHPRLRELLSSEIVLMRIFEDGDWAAFEKAVNRAIPIYGDLPLFDELDSTQESTLLLSP